MLFAAYGAPAPPRGKNPLLIVLGVCGGCVLLIVIGVVIMAVVIAPTVKGLAGGMVKMTQTMPAFLADLKSHDYKSAASLIDPSAQGRLTESKIRSMEESVEKKLGKMQSYGTAFSSTEQRKVSAPGDTTGQISMVEYIYSYPVTYQKGSATATFKFLFDASGAKTGDLSKMKISGKVTDFSIQADSQQQ